MDTELMQAGMSIVVGTIGLILIAMFMCVIVIQRVSKTK